MAQGKPIRVHIHSKQSLCCCFKLDFVLDPGNCYDYDVSSDIQVNIYPIDDRCLSLHCHFVCLPNREAVRQRKALSRTSSNILLNSVQNQSYNYQPSNNRMKVQNARPSDCEEPNLTIKEFQQESHSEISDLEVN